MARISDWLAGHIGFPTVQCAKGLWRGAGVWPMRKLRLFQRLAHAEPHVWQAHRNQRLKLVLSHALQGIPFYQYLNTRLVDVAQQDPMAALTDFPVLTKRDFQEHGEELLATDIPQRRIKVNYSGGSTGEPTRFYQDRARNVIRQLGAIRDQMYTGWKPGERIGLIWGADPAFFWETSLLYAVQNAIAERFLGLNAYEMTPHTMLAFLSQLEEHKARLILAYTGAADEFAAFIEERGLVDRAHALDLHGVVCSAEKIYPSQRERIERVFGCKVFDRYGSREIDVAAMECRTHDGLHVSADNVVLEILDERGQPVPQGETGRVVVTDLWNLGFGLIRYDLDDWGQFLDDVPSPCPCGVTFPRIAPVEGRTWDFFRAIDGSLVHGQYVTALLFNLSGLKAFQIIQESLENFVILLVGNRDVVNPQLEGVLARVRERLPGTGVTIRYGDSIPLTSAGKRQFTICKVASNPKG